MQVFGFLFEFFYYLLTHGNVFKIPSSLPVECYINSKLIPSYYFKSGGRSIDNGINSRVDTMID